jgi:hypothetical protein
VSYSSFSLYIVQSKEEEEEEEGTCRICGSKLLVDY